MRGASSRWTCTICGPRNRSDGTFRVHVSISLVLSRSVLARLGYAPRLESSRVSGKCPRWIMLNSLYAVVRLAEYIGDPPLNRRPRRMTCSDRRAYDPPTCIVPTPMGFILLGAGECFLVTTHLTSTLLRIWRPRYSRRTLRSEVLKPCYFCPLLRLLACSITYSLTTPYLQIHYTASCARSDKRDPQRPVALENVRDVPGLMTIVDRLD